MSSIERRWQRAMIVAAILLAAAIIAATQYLQPAIPTAAVGPDAPPQGVDLLYFVNPGRHHSLVAYDWAGNRRGSITFPSWVDLTRLKMAPDGSSFLIEPAFDGDWLGYFDRLGNTTMETNTGLPDSALWADDNRHLCLLAGQDIVIKLTGFPDRVTTISPQVYETPGQLGLAACSMRSDTALLVSVGDSAITGARIRLSSGKSLNEASFGTDANVVVSADAALVAVGHTDGAPTMIYRAGDLIRPVEEVKSPAIPVAFSGDGRSVLILDGAGMELVDWTSGRQRWRLDQPPGYAGSVLTHPSSSDLAFAISNGNGSPTGIFIVHRDGTTTDLDHGTPIAW